MEEITLSVVMVAEADSPYLECALYSVYNALYGMDIEVFIVDRGLSGELKKKIHQYTLDNYVIIVFDNEIAHPFSLISDFDVFVGSTWMGGKGEGFGLIYVEALSQGVPVIAISVGAAPEIISPEVGILASDNSAKQHKSLLEKLSNTAERNRFNRDYIRQYAYRFDISNTVSAILSQYGV